MSSRAGSAGGLKGRGENEIFVIIFNDLREFLVGLLAVLETDPQVDEVCHPANGSEARKKTLKGLSKKISKVPLTVFY
jgi:hypothetical protein